jgi:predicted metal-binding membrane protein
MSLRAHSLVLGLVLCAALVAWLASVQHMRGMDAGPGTSLGALGWFIGVWVTMSAAMMLPSAAPAVSLFSRLRGGGWAAAFVAGYLAAWTAYGLGAYGLDRVVRAGQPSFLAWGSGGAWVAGGTLAAAGIYQLTRLKAACLRQCRSPAGLLVRGRGGPVGALALGLGHGAYCVGCCFGLMLTLFALGAMSLTWMVVVGLGVALEKLAPGGEKLARPLAVALVALGLWVALAPASVPGLTQPGHAPMGMG